MDYNSLFQKKSAPHAYKNLEYGVGFFHDFVAYRSLRSQIKGVQKKYDRRIARFFDHIAQPTLFIRYCWDKDELLTIADNYSIIEELIKEFNNENEIAIITHDVIDDTIADKIGFLFPIEKKENEELNHSPILASEVLNDILNNAFYNKREANLAFEKEKQECRKKTFFIRVREKVISFRKKRIYKHSNQC